MTLSRQQIFDIGLAGVLAQGEPSIDWRGGTCLYRKVKPDGKVLKCNAGHLIPDHLMTGHMEDMSIDSPDILNTFFDNGILEFTTKPSIVQRQPVVGYRFLEEFQRAHDIAAKSTIKEPEKFIDRYKQIMLNLAFKFELVTTLDIPPAV